MHCQQVVQQSRQEGLTSWNSMHKWMSRAAGCDSLPTRLYCVHSLTCRSTDTSKSGIGSRNSTYHITNSL